VAAIRQMALWPEIRSRAGALLVAAIAFSLIRARDQPGLDIGIGSTTATVVPGDVLLLALFVVAVILLVRSPPARLALAAIAAASVFALLILVTGAANGSASLVSGVKAVEVAALGLGAFVLVRRESTLEAVAEVVLLFTLAADLVAVVQFVRNAGGRQASFLGEHDFAALAILALVYGFVLLLERRRSGRAALAIAAGGLGCILGGALASLLGLYVAAVLLVALAAARRRLDWRRLAIVVATVAVVTGGTAAIRGGELNFLRSWFGPPPSRPGEYAGSWSQRLIYAYVGGRVFLAHPVLGVGWYPELPPQEYRSFLAAAHRRFSDQPSSYFPRADGTFVPQQTYDQVLYELGVVGAAALLVLLVAAAAASARAARRLRRLADLPAAWLAATLGALAGQGYFGGTPLAATLWLVAGVALACAAWEAA
jgi:hypothetical protein